MRPFDYKTGDKKGASKSKYSYHRVPITHSDTISPLYKNVVVKIAHCPRCWHRLEGFLWKCACGSWEEVSTGVYQINKS